MKKFQRLIYKTGIGKYFFSTNASFLWLLASLLSVFVVTAQCSAIEDAIKNAIEDEAKKIAGTAKKKCI